MGTDDRRTRILALALITLVFVVFTTALLYWAVNVAPKGIQSRVFINTHERNPLAKNSIVEQIVETPTQICHLDFAFGKSSIT